ncbi:RNA polymerase sigma factor [Nonomuraea longicatena]|uniref:RNA polymerase sigma factor n=1 Tax=Nonomuraea longicatena TaxID=83682 RepID=A0ABN1PJ45_9ACTN
MVSAALSGRVPAGQELGADAADISASVADPDRFARVFDRHSDEIHRYAARRLGADRQDLADDVTAETFLVAFRKRRRYDLTRPDARPWLYGIAANLIAKHRRTEVRKLKALARAAEPDTDAFEQRSVDRMDAQRLGPRLAAALASLRTAERELLFLVTWAELSYEQAAEALGVPVGTVRSRLSRTRAKIRAAMEGRR